MKIELLYQKGGYYIGYSKENHLLCAWLDKYDLDKDETTHTILCQYNDKTKNAMFSVILDEYYIDKNFLIELDKCLNKYGFNK